MVLARIAVMLLFSVGLANVWACRCLQPSIDQSFAQSELVVYATVADFVTAPSGEGGTAILNVTHSWKYPSPKRIAVTSLSSCSYPFEPGRSYLVFLNKDTRGMYETGLCSGNKPLVKDEEFNEALNRLQGIK